MKNAKGYEVGQTVRVIKCTYGGRFTVGLCYCVVEVGEKWVGLLDNDGCGDDGLRPSNSGFCFYNDEIEPQ